MGTLINVIAEDFGYLLSFSLQDSMGNIFNLTGATGLIFKAQITGVSGVKISSAMSVLNPTAGTCSYTVGANDFTQEGTYDAQVVVTFGSQVVTFSGITVNCAPKIPYTQ